jgi:hypothetical protein
VNTKFVYIFALLSLAMSSFAVAASKTPRTKKLKYQTSSPVSGTDSTRKETCAIAREQMENIPLSSDCQGRGESGVPFEVEPDSDCVCPPAIATSPASGAIECTFGVHWSCHYSDKDHK